MRLQLNERWELYNALRDSAQRSKNSPLNKIFHIVIEYARTSIREGGSSTRALPTLCARSEAHSHRITPVFTPTPAVSEDTQIKCLEDRDPFTLATSRSHPTPHPSIAPRFAPCHTLHLLPISQARGSGARKSSWRRSSLTASPTQALRRAFTVHTANSISPFTLVHSRRLDAPHRPCTPGTRLLTFSASNGCITPARKHSRTRG